MPATAQSLGALLKCARDIMREVKGINGDLDCLSRLFVESDRNPLEKNVSRPPDDENVYTAWTIASIPVATKMSTKPSPSKSLQMTPMP